MNNLFSFDRVSHGGGGGGGTKCVDTFHDCVLNVHIGKHNQGEKIKNIYVDFLESLLWFSKEEIFSF
jgi:hypothetical protein